MKKKITTELMAYSGLLIALEIVLNRFCSINTMGLKIGFGFVPIVVAAIMFGPIPAAIVYALADLIGALLFPIGPYFPGFTVCAAAMGAVYGLFLHKNNGKKLKFFPDIIVPVLINSLIIGLLINTVWVSVLYGSKTYWGWFVYRLPEYIILIPTNCIIIPVISRLIEKIGRQKNKSAKN